MQAKLVNDIPSGYAEVKYELFDNITTKDIDGNDVVIPKSIGKFTLSQLNRNKTILEAQLKNIQDKIDAINGIISE